MSQLRLARFAADINRARDLVGLGQSIGSLTHGRVDESDLYRSAIVQAVGALDSYIHGTVLDRAVDILLGRSSAISNDTKIGLHFGAVSQMLSAQTPADLELAARTQVAQRLGLETYQQPDDIARALAMVGVSKIWSTAFPDAGAAKTSISLIVRRRNRIVHECDVDLLTLGQPTSISATDALESVNTIDSTVRCIDSCC